MNRKPADVLHTLPPATAALITGEQFFPSLISAPFMHGLALGFSCTLYLISGLASWLGGGKYTHDEAEGAGLFAEGEEETDGPLPQQAE